jgi:hypothetical protein|tara:strand:+ start:1122 stop:1664 length:543 start_codon:yes stop_codon:yes gene_type:complete
MKIQFLNKNIFIKSVLMLIASIISLLAPIFFVSMIFGFEFIFFSGSVNFLIMSFIFIALISILSIFIVSSAMKNLFFNLNNHPFLVSIGLFTNLIILFYTIPRFALFIRSNFSLLVVAMLGWLFFPIIIYPNRFREKIPKFLQKQILYLSYQIVMLSVYFFAILDVIFILIAMAGPDFSI